MANHGAETSGIDSDAETYRIDSDGELIGIDDDAETHRNVSDDDEGGYDDNYDTVFRIWLSTHTCVRMWWWWTEKPATEILCPECYHEKNSPPEYNETMIHFSTRLKFWGETCDMCGDSVGLEEQCILDCEECLDKFLKQMIDNDTAGLITPAVA